MQVYAYLLRVYADASRNVQLSQGTGWLYQVGDQPPIVVTAFHVVTDKDSAQWFHETHGPVCYVLEHKTMAGDVTDFGLKPLKEEIGADLALLACDDSAFICTPSGLQALRIGVGSPQREDRWLARGFPSGRQKTGLSVTPIDFGGEVTNLRTDEAIFRQLQLLVKQQSDGGWKGASGSPVCTAQGVVGVLTQERNGNTLYATPLGALRALVGLVTQEPKNLAERLAARVRRFSADGALGIEDFLGHYLGTESQPAPFGGRHQELSKLSAWMADPEPKTKRCLLLVAPAGRGKSALLARWVADLAAHESAALVYFPISLRFGTNRPEVIFASLAAQLAHLRGEEGPNRQGMDASAWRAQCRDWLREPLPSGRPLLVVLDGLDETTGWQGEGLFPPEIPKHVRVVVAVRSVVGDKHAESWLRSLRWERSAQVQDLALLSEEGLREVLESMGCPLDAVAARGELLSQLFRLTEGDPLLVGLYAQDLWQQGEEARHLSPEDLTKLTPGITGYIEEWFKQHNQLQGKELSEDAALLGGLLSCAFAPLRRIDIEALAPEGTLFHQGIKFKSALGAMNRFLIGDGKENGFSFSHPRIGFYFRETLSEKERNYWDEQFIIWGKKNIIKLNKKEISPENISSYIVYFYRHHLERAAKEVEGFLPLLSDGWRRGWEYLDSSYTGFLSDVSSVLGFNDENHAYSSRRVFQHNETACRHGQLAPYLGDEIRCALYRASVTSLSINISGELIGALVKNKMRSFSWALEVIHANNDSKIIFQKLMSLHQAINNKNENLKQICQKALVIARSISDNGFRVQALVKIVPLLPAHETEAVLQEALAVARSISDDWFRPQALASIIPLLPAHETAAVLQEALAVARSISDDWFRAGALASIAPLLPTNGALAVAHSISDDWFRAQTLAKIAPLLPPYEALAVAHSISDDWFRAGALASIASILTPQDAVNVLQKALGVAHSICNEENRAEALAKIAPFLPPHEALEVARSISDDWFRVQALAKIAPLLPPHEALEVARSISSDRLRAEALTSIVPILPPHEIVAVLQEALVTGSISDHRFRAEALINIAPLLSPHETEVLLQKALVVAHSVSNDWLRAPVLAKIALLLPPHETAVLLQEALVVAHSISGDRLRAEALAKITPLLSPQDALLETRSISDNLLRAQALAKIAPLLSPQDALFEARSISDDRFRAEALASIAPLLPPHETATVLKEALAVGNSISDEENRKWALASIAPLLPPHEALVVARSISDNWLRAEALAKIAPLLPPHETKAVLQEALAAARSISDNWLRAGALAKIAPLLPPHETKAVLQEALSVARSISEDWFRPQTLVSIEPALPVTFLLPLYQEVKTLMYGNENRKQILNHIATLVPVIKRLGGENALRETAEAIQDVGEWWP